MILWSPWHGCHKISAGCQNCYVYRGDSRYDKDSSVITKTAAFNLPVQKYKRTGEYKFNPSGGVFTCGTSDFFVEEADDWRKDAWAMMRERYDIRFFIITKRIDRFKVSLPQDWGEGYDNVYIGCTCENQEATDYRLPIFLNLPLKHKAIIHGPMLEAIDITKHLKNGNIKNLKEVSLSGESTPGTPHKARIFDEAWIQNTKRQCDQFNIPCTVHQLGTRFKYQNKIYIIKRRDEFRLAQKYMCLNKWGPDENKNRNA